MMARDIIFFSLAGPVEDYTGAHTVIFREVFFCILFSRRKSETAMGTGHVRGGGSIVIFKKPNNILFLDISRGFLCIFRRKDQRSCDGWTE